MIFWIRMPNETLDIPVEYDENDPENILHAAKCLELYNLKSTQFLNQLKHKILLGSIF